jgi:outer membrane murein-binding lipoprotein Lpp
MNLLKHMEAVFIATVVLAVSSTYLADTLPTAHARQAAAPSTSAVPVVVVSAKRMSAQEKLQAARADAARPASRI